MYLIVLLLIILFYLWYSPKPLSKLLYIIFAKKKVVYPSNYEQIHKKINIINDLNYPSQYPNNKLDLYLPKNDQKNPVIFVVHGGAYIGGDKKDNSAWCAVLASNGFAVVSINYALAPKHKYPTPIYQMRESYQFLKEVERKYFLNLNQVFFAGDSAGAQIVAQFIAIETNFQLAKLMNLKPITNNNIKAALLYCGPYDVEQLANVKNKITRYALKQVVSSYLGKRNWQNDTLLNEALVINHLTSNFPAVFITDGNFGSFESHSINLANSLKKHNVKTTTLFFDKKESITNHVYHLDMDSNAGKVALNQTLKFLDENITN